MDKAFLAGRILFSGFFLRSGVNLILKFEGITNYTASKGVPLPELAVIVAATLLILGGISILTGQYPKIGSYLLIAFLVPVTIIMHDFWNIDDAAARGKEFSSFLRNFTFIGACLMFLALPEPWAFSLKIGKK
ncbi:MAG: DoxX family protein [Candidatus Marinimicrobia bacterium]|nr:DoxX family protein [Candidatus Neomarinimicrobiota bacterium]